MKLHFIKTVRLITLFAASALVCISCTQDSSFDSVSGSAKVQIPWLLTEGEPQLKIVELNKLESLRQLKGQYAQFFMQPYYSGNSIQGLTFNGRWSQKEKTFYPGDVLTAQLASMYAHFQALYELDRLMGLEKDQLWPRKIAVVTNPESSEVNGAFYDNDRDFYIFVPYTFAHVPLMVNGGVIAHEHFHSHFSRLVLNPLRSKKADGLSILKEIKKTESSEEALSEDELADYHKAVYQSILVRALNEGFADFWAFLYTQDEDFILRSLPKHAYRSLKISERPSLKFFSSSSLKEISRDPRFFNVRRFSHMNIESYVLGNEFAKKLIELSRVISEQEKISMQEASHRVGQELIQIFPTLLETLQADFSTNHLTSIYEFLKLIVSTERSAQKPYLCRSIQETMAFDGVLLSCPKDP